MAEWKKVVVSGSDISQLNNDAGYLTAADAAPNAFSTASFNGTNLLADQGADALNFASSSGAGLNISADASSDTLTFTLNAVPNSSLANSTFNVGAGSGLTDGGSAALGGTSTVNVGAGTHITVNANDVAVNTTTLTKAISGSILSTISGDVNVDASGASVIQAGAVEGTMLDSNVADGTTITLSSNTLSTLKVPNALTAGTGLSSDNGTFDGSGAATFSVDYGNQAGDAVEGNTTISFTGVSGETTVDAGSSITLGDGGTVTYGLADTISGNRTFSGQTITFNNDIVVQGTASFQETKNLQVADQFILLNSGSSTTGPGGIVIEQGTDDIGEALAWSSANSRWGVTGSFDAASTTFTPDAYVNVIVEGSTNDPDTEVVAKYDQKGNMFVGNTGEIWIYV